MNELAFPDESRRMEFEYFHPSYKLFLKQAEKTQ